MRGATRPPGWKLRGTMGATPPLGAAARVAARPMAPPRCCANASGAASETLVTMPAIRKTDFVFNMTPPMRVRLGRLAISIVPQSEVMYRRRGLTGGHGQVVRDG